MAEREFEIEVGAEKHTVLRFTADYSLNHYGYMEEFSVPVAGYYWGDDQEAMLSRDTIRTILPDLEEYVKEVLECNQE